MGLYVMTNPYSGAAEFLYKRELLACLHLCIETVRSPLPGPTGSVSAAPGTLNCAVRVHVTGTWPLGWDRDWRGLFRGWTRAWRQQGRRGGAGPGGARRPCRGTGRNSHCVAPRDRRGGVCHGCCGLTPSHRTRVLEEMLPGNDRGTHCVSENAVPMLYLLNYCHINPFIGNARIIAVTMRYLQQAMKPGQGLLTNSLNEKGNTTTE